MKGKRKGYLEELDNLHTGTENQVRGICKTRDPLIRKFTTRLLAGHSQHQDRSLKDSVRLKGCHFLALPFGLAELSH